MTFQATPSRLERSETRRIAVFSVRTFCSSCKHPYARVFCCALIAEDDSPTADREMQCKRGLAIAASVYLHASPRTTSYKTCC